MANAINIPGGMRDRLFSECGRRRELLAGFTDLFSRCGYREVMVPALEYYELFLRAGRLLTEETMYKLVDRDGRILVLRPDSTYPLARVYATKLKNEPAPQRLFYSLPVYRMDTVHGGRESEIMQAGIELVGKNGIRADLEVLSIAIRSLAMLGCDFRIEIGHAGLFKSLVSRVTSDPDLQEEIRSTVERKSYAALGDLLEPYGENESARALMRLINLFGGKEVLAEAERLAGDEEARAGIAYLRSLHTELSRAGLAERVRFDMGLVREIDYYTGIVFTAYVRGSGIPVLSGGRYDGLIGSFGVPAPGAGFSIHVDAVANCLPLPEEAPPEVLLHYEEGRLGDALEALVSFPPGTAELSLGESEDASLAIAAQKRAKRVVVFPASGGRREISLSGKEGAK
ncbi:ATP phosphoribosyltransferase regulatory subunit [Oscillospiraceae bacterium OttesenSCG-928-G22]|nr:ATP phosphoribosyltransferase regulatory subunit [Oscillospiraceae bacterium OttesenSCG-928-G22]